MTFGFAELIQKLVAEVEEGQNNDLTEQRDIKTLLPVLLQRGEIGTPGYLSLLDNIYHVFIMDRHFPAGNSCFSVFLGSKETLQQEKMNNMV